MSNAASTDLRSRLSKVKGLGTAHHGVGHWWLQRVTAVALVPLSVWFMVELICVLLTPHVVRIAEWFGQPLNAIMMVMLLVAAFIHAKLGVQVIIEDYIKSPVAKYTLLLLNSFFCFGFAVLCILAILKLHLLDVVAGV